MDDLLTPEEAAGLLIRSDTGRPVTAATVRRLLREGHLEWDRDHSLVTPSGEVVRYIIRRDDVIDLLSKRPDSIGKYNPGTTDPRHQRQRRRRTALLEMLMNAKMTAREVTDRLNVSVSTVYRDLRALSRRGRIHKEGDRYQA